MSIAVASPNFFSLYSILLFLSVAIARVYYVYYMEYLNQIGKTCNLPMFICLFVVYRCGLEVWNEEVNKECDAKK